MLSFHLYINGILIIVPIDNWCHPRRRRSILGICRSKGLNYVLTFWLTPFLKSFVDTSFFSNSFFGLDLSDWRLESSKSFLSSNSTLWLWDYFYILVLYYIIWNYYFSNSSLELGEACSVAADCGDPQVLWILLWRCRNKTSFDRNDTQALIFSMLRYHDYNCDNTNLFSSGVLLRAQTCSLCRILSLDRAL